MRSEPFRAPPGFVEVGARPGLALDIRYASTRNILGRDLYGGDARLFLHAVAAGKLLRAAELLGQRRPDLSLLVFDGLRPNRVQRLFWEVVRGTPMQPYVADPATGSVHGFGFAVDLSLRGPEGEVDMGSPFDDLSSLSEPRLEEAFLAEGRLTAAQVASRRLLRTVMTEAGFLPIDIEWWHFDALEGAQVRAAYPLVE